MYRSIKVNIFLKTQLSKTGKKKSEKDEITQNITAIIDIEKVRRTRIRKRRRFFCNWMPAKVCHEIETTTRKVFESFFKLYEVPKLLRINVELLFKSREVEESEQKFGSKSFEVRIFPRFFY